MISDFKCKESERIWNDQRSRKFSAAIERKAMQKLYMLDAAMSLSDLKVPPGNRLEALKHDRKGQHSIRVNKQWRICFRWNRGHVKDVEITDYH